MTLINFKEINWPEVGFLEYETLVPSHLLGYYLNLLDVSQVVDMQPVE